MNTKRSSGAPTLVAFGEMHPSSLLANSLKSKCAAPSGKRPHGWVVPFALHCVVSIYSSRFSTSDSLPGDVTHCPFTFKTTGSSAETFAAGNTAVTMSELIYLNAEWQASSWKVSVLMFCWI